MTSRQNPHLTLETLALPKKKETAKQRTLKLNDSSARIWIFQSRNQKEHQSQEIAHWKRHQNAHMLVHSLVHILWSVYDRFAINLTSICINTFWTFFSCGVFQLMQFWWRFHGGYMEVWCRFDVGFMEVLKAPVSTLVGSLMQSDWCRFDGGSMEVPCRFDVGFMEVLKAPVSTLAGSLM